MAEQLIQARRKPFEPAGFVDHYEEALRTLVQSKMKGETPVFAPVQQPSAVIDLMAALKQSLRRTALHESRPRAASARQPSRRPLWRSPPRNAAKAAPPKPAAKAAVRRRKAS